MTVTAIRCGFKATINLGNFESITIDVFQEATLEDGEAPEIAIATLMDETVKRVKEQVRMRKGDRSG